MATSAHPVGSVQHGGEAIAGRPEFGWLARAGLVAREVSSAAVDRTARRRQPAACWTGRAGRRSSLSPVPS